MSYFKDTENRQAQRWVEFSIHFSNEHNRLADSKNQLVQAIQTFITNIYTATHFYKVHQLELEQPQENLDAKINDVISKKIIIMFNLLREQDNKKLQKEYQNI